MKKVIQQQTETINLNDITDNSIVGLISESKTNRIFIIEKEPKYFVGVSKDLTTYNSWGRTTIKEYVRDSITEYNTTAYVFNTTKELYKWLSE